MQLPWALWQVDLQFMPRPQKPSQAARRDVHDCSAAAPVGIQVGATTKSAKMIENKDRMDVPSKWRTAAT